MIPQHEMDNLTMVTRTAESLAEAGDLAAGYGALLAGLQRAEESRDQDADWGGELVRRWQAARDHYVATYGVSIHEEQP